MAGGSVQYLVEDADVVAILQALEVALSPVGLMPWMEGPLAAYMEERVASRFATEGDDVTGKWVPLSAATQAIRTSQGYGGAHPINVRTGEMEEFVRTHAVHSEGDAGVVFHMPQDMPQGELAAKMDMAQNGGTTEQGKPVPARPVLGMNLADLDVVTRLLSEHVNHGGSLL